MRFGRYIALELILVLVFGSIAGSAILWGASTWLHNEQDRVHLAARLPPHGEIEGPLPAAPIELDATGMFLGMSDALLLKRVQSQPIVRTKLNRGGSSISFRLDLADGSRAAFKPAQTNLQSIPRKEVAAYWINRMLGLNAVPPAAPRSLSRDDLLANLHPDSRRMLPRILAETIFNRAGRTMGMVQYWIPRIVDSGFDSQEGIERSLNWLTIGQMVPPDSREMAAQISNLIVFDFLTANPDRYSGGNMKMSPGGQKLYFMDNTMAFYLQPDGHSTNRRVLQRSQRFSRQLYESLSRLTPIQIRANLSKTGRPPEEILTVAETRAVVSRRQFVQRHIDSLIAMHGERSVLLFP